MSEFAPESQLTVEDIKRLLAEGTELPKAVEKRFRGPVRPEPPKDPANPDAPAEERIAALEQRVLTLERRIVEMSQALHGLDRRTFMHQRIG